MNPALHAFTPTLHVIDPRGLAITTVAFYRVNTSDVVHPRIQRHAYNAAGHLIRQWDARLWALNDAPPNQTSIHSLGGQPLRTASVDAGHRVRLHGAAGQVLEQWDARNTHRLNRYDEQLRPVSVEERTPATGSRITERFTYGDVAQTATNCCTRLIRHDDTAGRHALMACGLSGQPLAYTLYFLADTCTPDWPALPEQRDALLERDKAGALKPFTTAWQYDALGAVLSQTDARGNLQQHQYDASGQLASSRLAPADEPGTVALLQARIYGPGGQVLSETLGNGVTTTSVFSPTDGRLQQLSSARSGAVLQHLNYVHDPVGNVLSVDDGAQPTDWFKGEQVNAINRYVYDTLYQLVEASGRESLHAGIQPHLPGLVLPGGGDASRRRNYTQTFNYDAGGNLLTLKHGQMPARTMKVDTHSNRSLYQADPDNPPDISKGFDANGNLLHLEGAQGMHWDTRNQLQRVTRVIREAAPSSTPRCRAANRTPRVDSIPQIGSLSFGKGVVRVALGLSAYPLLWSRRLKVPALRRVTLQKRQSNQNALAPTTRCLAVARHALTTGLAPWARRDRPSLAVSRLTRRPAGLPTAQNLRSASVV